MIKVVESGSKNIEIAVINKQGTHFVEEGEVENFVKQIEEEKAAAEEKKDKK